MRVGRAFHVRVWASLCAALGVAVVSTDAAAQGGWRIRTERSEMTDARSVTLSLAALSTVQGVIGGVVPILTVRCIEGELEALLWTGSILGSNEEETPISVRFDSNPAVPWGATISTDMQSAFFTGREDFLANLLHSRTLRVEYSPYDALPRVARFAVSGLSAYLGRLGSACPSASALRKVLDPITLVGNVTALFGDAPIRGALIRVLGSTTRTQSDSGGSFTLRLPRKVVGVAVSASGFVADTSLVEMPRDFPDSESIVVRLTSSRDSGLGQLRADLLRLDSVQTGFFSRTGRYSASLGELPFQETPSVTIRILVGDASGWNATASAGRVPGYVCAIHRGSAPSLVATAEGVPKCIRQ
jgi:hypothetical protein